LHYFSPQKPLFLVDPNPQITARANLTIIEKNAVEGMKELSQLLKDFEVWS
jgi:hypothetical protein